MEFFKIFAILKTNLPSSIKILLFFLIFLKISGFGFGKSLEHNYQLLAQFALFAEHGYPVLAGISRKSMLGKVTQQEVSDRLVPSIAAAIMAVERGAKIVRTHDVRETVDALKIWQAMREQELTSFIMKND